MQAEREVTVSKACRKVAKRRPIFSGGRGPLVCTSPKRVCTRVHVCNMVPNFIQNGIKMVSVGPSGPKLYEVGSKLAPCWP